MDASKLVGTFLSMNYAQHGQLYFILTLPFGKVAHGVSQESNIEWSVARNYAKSCGPGNGTGKRLKSSMKEDLYAGKS